MSQVEMTTQRRLAIADANKAAGAESASPSPAVKKTKRLNVNLPEPLFKELTSVSKSSGRSLTEIVRLALGLVVKATEVEQAGHKLAVLDSDGKLLKELVLPK